MLFCLYDKVGNVFVSGVNTFYHMAFAELAKGTSQFQKLALTLPGHPPQPGGMQWYGKHLTVAPADGNVIYEYGVEGTRARLLAHDPSYWPS